MGNEFKKKSEPNSKALTNEKTHTVASMSVHSKNGFPRAIQAGEGWLSIVINRDNLKKSHMFWGVLVCVIIEQF